MVRGVESHPSKLSQLQLKRNRPPGPAAGTAATILTNYNHFESHSCHCRNNVTAGCLNWSSNEKRGNLIIKFCTKEKINQSLVSSFSIPYLLEANKTKDR